MLFKCSDIETETFKVNFQEVKKNNTDPLVVEWGAMNLDKLE